MIFGRTEIAEAYLEGGSASAVAKRLNEHHRTDYFTGSRVLSVWTEQYLNSTFLQQLGERPLHGFDQTGEKVQLAQAIMAAA